ncbi:MAG: sugar kinase [Acidobacteria bacterium]|nr:sugar kinase [Acidobacteriota bacterium]
MKQRLTENKLILIKRRTRLDEMIVRYNTVNQARFYIEHQNADFSDYQAEHDQYNEALRTTENLLGELGRVQTVDRAFLPNFIFGKDDTIVVLGQDGLVANTVKYAPALPIIGVNPDPKRWDGVLLPFTVKDLPKIVPEVFTQRRQFQEVSMAKAQLNNGQALYAVNDFFVGVKSHTSARYMLQIGNQKEQQSSSGVIISTGLGSTGWFTSLMRGALEVASRISGQTLSHQYFQKLSWDADMLYYTVREPFPSKTSSTSLVFGAITPATPLKLISQMSESGVIFSDGIERDFLEFNSGTQATITLAEEKGHLIV